ncbi:MAG: hypothetical protein ACRYGP_08580, partial [Janthinobacterium lividum]
MTAGSRDRVSGLGRARSAVLIAAALSGASSGVARAESPGPDVLDCTTIPRGGDESTLVRRFGRAAVRTVELDGAEGQKDRGTALNPGDPARRLNVFWSDSTHRRHPASVVIRDRS